jgi:hypothetical protein
MKLPGFEPDLFLSKITRPRWLELPIDRTDFDSPFEFEPAKFYCTIRLDTALNNVIGI